MGGLGGFGALFDLKAPASRDPVLVSTTDGVGTKLKIAIECGEHRTIGIDLVAMCVNDLVVQGAEPLLFLDYSPSGELDVETAATIIEGIAEGCRAAGCCAGRRGDGGDAGPLRKGDYDLAGFAVGAGGAEPHPSARRYSAGDLILGLASSGVHSNGYSLVRRVAEKSGLPGPIRLLRTGERSARRCLRRHGSMSAPASPRSRTGAVKALAPHHRRRAARKHPAGAAKRSRGGDRSCNDSRSARCFAGSRGSRWPNPRCSAPSIAGSE